MNLKNLLKVAFLSACLLTNYTFAQTTTTIPDATITNDVQNKINADRSLSGTSIKADTADGVVTLSGNVDTDSQASTVTEIAQATAGVKDVDTSKLTVKGSDQPVADSLITAKIKGMFVQRKLFGSEDIAAMSIKVETNNGVVTLTGSADNQNQIDNAITIAKSISGVTDVKSNVQIATTTNQ